MTSNSKTLSFQSQNPGSLQKKLTGRILALPMSHYMPVLKSVAARKKPKSLNLSKIIFTALLRWKSSIKYLKENMLLSLVKDMEEKSRRVKKIKSGAENIVKQKNTLYLLFSCEGKYWPGRSTIQSICSAPGLDCVPLAGNFTLHEAVQTVRGGFCSLLGKGIKTEGLTGKTSIPLFDARRRRLICKIKSSDF